MKVRTGKSRGFRIFGTERELNKLSVQPGTTWRKSEGYISMPETFATWNYLRQQDFNFTIGARERFNELEKTYKEKRRVLRSAENRFKLKPTVCIKAPLKSIPYEHQSRAFGFCSALGSSGCFADQGTGKSLIAIAIAGTLYVEGKINRVMLITPKNVRQVWPNQLSAHADFPWNASISKKPPLNEPCLQFWAVSYDSVAGLMKEIKSWRPDMYILDESHRIKNRKSKRFKSVKSAIGKCKHRLLLSGSPIGKCLTEAWSQYNIIDPEVFGSYSNFIKKYIVKGGWMGKQIVGYQNEDEFYERFHSKTFRVTKEECLDLPPLTYQKIYVELTKPLRDTYNKFAEELFIETDEGEIVAPSAAVANIKLRQIAGGMVKTNDGNLARLNKVKMDAFREFLEDRLNDKTVVFFSFTHELAAAEEVCKKLKIKSMTLSGKSKDRDSFETRFQTCKSPCVALIQVDTGAEGLTLHSADYALFYSPSFSFIKYLQARDRIYRIGTTKKVTIGFLIMEDTIDLRVVDVLESNGRLFTNTLETNRKYKLRK